jgi:[CysO sulfur-carrier protein]-S-L-cysteine hydrolase
MKISQELIDEIVAHAREDAPNECCGLVAGRDGAATAVHRAENLFASPTRFEVGDLPRLLRRIEEAGDELVGMYHSHTRSEAKPSETDKNLAGGWPGVIWFICSLMDPDEPVVRAFLIDGSEVADVELGIAEG